MCDYYTANQYTHLVGIKAVLCLHVWQVTGILIQFMWLRYSDLYGKADYL